MSSSIGCQLSAERRAPHQISPPHSSTTFACPPSPSRPGISTQLNFRYEGSLMANSSRCQVNRIDVLPDDVLLEIFGFYVEMDSRLLKTAKMREERWHFLVHVCRRWRTLVLKSPRRLNLRLYCSPETPAKDALDVWPALPLMVEGVMSSASSTDDIIVALGQSNRVCLVNLQSLADRQLEQVLAAMQVPFPELTDLDLQSNGKTLPVIPDSFLDGSAPRLRTFKLCRIPFPGLPNLLLSAAHLVVLYLYDIPHSGYISPEAIVAPLSALSSLEWLCLEFRSPQSCPDRRPPPSKRSVVPALYHFYFKGVTEYLEDLVTCIDTPRLEELVIGFFNQIDFYTPRLAQYINRTPKFAKRHAHVYFDDNFAVVELSPGILQISVSCIEPDWQLSCIEQVCNSSLHPLSTVKDLYIDHRYLKLVWKDDAVDNSLWLQLFLPFTAVKNLYLRKIFAPGISATLQELVGGRIAEVLPGLENIFVEGLERPDQKDIGQFVAARQLSDHPIAISVWNRSFGLTLKSLI